MRGDSAAWVSRCKIEEKKKMKQVKCPSVVSCSGSLGVDNNTDLKIDTCVKLPSHNVYSSPPTKTGKKALQYENNKKRNNKKKETTRSDFAFILAVGETRYMMHRDVMFSVASIARGSMTALVVFTVQTEKPRSHLGHLNSSMRLVYNSNSTIVDAVSPVLQWKLDSSSKH